MSTTTTFTSIDTLARTDAKPRKGFFDRMMEARAKRGEAAVRYQMSRMSDETLKSLGFTAEQVASIRLNGKVPPNFWR